MKCALLAFILALPVLAQDRRIQPVSASARRVALVIGNNAYAATPLQNSVRDAQAMKTVLEAAGFTVRMELNTVQQKLEEAIDAFVATVRPGDVALFYYSGHGIQLQDENYLIPVDFQAPTAVVAKYKSFPINRLLESLEAAGASIDIVILDACRDNPYRSIRSGSGGLAPMQAGRGTYLAFATAPGKTASDNAGGQNGLFTGALVSYLRQPGYSLDDVFNQVRQRVSEQSADRQIPWSTSSVVGNFYFVGGPPAVVSAKLDAAAEAWALIRNSDRAEDFDDFVTSFPNSDLAGAARMRAGQLRRGAAETLRTQPTATSARPGDTQVNPKDGLTYVWIPPGTFTMGCSAGDTDCDGDEKPAHQVTISKGFWMGQTEVTQEAFQRVTGNNPSKFKGSKLPVEQVTWNQAKSYCEAVGMRLPTEAEWEYAAKSGTSGARYGALDDVAWYNSNSSGKTHEVGQKQANGFVLNDMLGNVWEWVSDWYGSYSAAAASDPQGAQSGTFRLLRGGSWFVNPGLVRVSNRLKNGPENHLFFGFRCNGN
jgi:formylglycine-generating enzyme required for sulfatase activity